MLERVLTAVAIWILNQLKDWAMNEAKKAYDKSQQDKTNEENAHAYQEAKDRAERIKRAEELLNGSAT
jgi:hypothetical protein